mmetsp:Transcript_21126/g.29600  ORF Transcript_21126/g.29600 Transcript_21126/m.29600 type:complete len:267 (-) Transcript_21126:239-1039(-)
MTVAKTAYGFLLLLGISNGFSAFHSVSSNGPNRVGGTVMSRSMAPPKDGGGISGSFFNPVPENDKEGEKNQPPQPPQEQRSEENSFEEDLMNLMRQRKARPRASQPSTLGGVPTSKATGFGKQSSPKAKIIKTTKRDNASNSSSNQSFVGIGKPLNDVNNPEYDDQGYTLYANEETGEKKRVFEALVDYPCDFTMKIVGANEGAFAAEIVQIVADSCGVTCDEVKHTLRTNGKWISVTVKAPVKNAEMLYTLYENIDRDPRVKFKF